MSRAAWIVLMMFAAGMPCLPRDAAAQSRDALRDLQLSQRLYQAVADHFKTPYVESKVGSLRTGGRIAQVVLTDSATFHADPETQRRAARAVAEYVKQQLPEEKDLTTIRIGWKYAPTGAVSTAVTYDFSPTDLTSGEQQATPS